MVKITFEHRVLNCGKIDVEPLDNTNRLWREQLLDDAKLEEYLTTFYGYGNYSGDHWFIGK